MFGGGVEEVVNVSDPDAERVHDHDDDWGEDADGVDFPDVLGLIIDSVGGLFVFPLFRKLVVGVVVDAEVFAIELEELVVQEIDSLLGHKGSELGVKGPVELHWFCLFIRALSLLYFLFRNSLFFHQI